MRGTPIAIVGLACRFGGAPNAATFWSHIEEKHQAFHPIGDARWKHDAWLPTGRAANRTSCRKIAWLDDVAGFAARNFGVSPLRAEAMDPQQRLTLETAREALIDAGLEARPFSHARSSAFVGISVSEYSRIMVSGIRARQMAIGDFGSAGGDPEASACQIATATSYTISGSLLSMAASVLSKTFDLRGPCLAVDGACASSLQAVALGVQHLRALAPTRVGEPAPLSLACGAYVNLVPDTLIGFSRVGVLANEVCRPFDVAAEGFLIGEGVGVVVLKRLDDAVRDGDRIYAVLRGIASSSDGAAEGPMAPSLVGQVRVMRAALEDARLAPRGLGYVECHGTGTVSGDAVELAALDEVLPQRRSPYVLGSVKANIGHTLSASGIAGLLRATLAVYPRTLPPQAGFEAWRPELESYRARFSLPRARRPWASRVRHAMVASYGFGGLNCAAVLSQAPPYMPSRQKADRPVPFCISAPTPALLQTHLQEIRRVLDEDVVSAAYTLTVTRAVHRHALLFSACNRDEAIRSIDAAMASLSRGVTAWTAGCVLGPRDDFVTALPTAPPQVAALLELGAAHLRGETVCWDDVFPSDMRRIADLPACPLERQRYWIVASSQPSRSA